MALRVTTGIPPIFIVTSQLKDYACRDDRGSLYPILPTTTREELYCTKCQYYQNGMRQAGCLFVPSWEEPSMAARRKRRQSETAEKRRAALRSAGRNAGGGQLKRTCWNCVEIRHATNGGYTCPFLPAPCTRSAGSMQQHQGCEMFAWRTEEILPLS